MKLWWYLVIILCGFFGAEFWWQGLWPVSLALIIAATLVAVFASGSSSTPPPIKFFISRGAVKHKGWRSLSGQENVPPPDESPEEFQDRLLQEIVEDDTYRMVDRSVFRSFLQENGRDPTLIDAAMEVMEPLFRQAEKSKWHLVTRDAIAEHALSDAISRAIGRPVDGITFLSHSTPPKKPRCFSKEEWQEQLAVLGNRFVGYTKLDSLLQCVLHTNYQKEHREDVGDDSYTLHETLVKNFGYKLFGDVHYIPAAGSISVIFHYLAFILAGRKEEADRFIPLLGYLTGLLVLHEDEGSPGTWRVLCA